MSGTTTVTVTLPLTNLQEAQEGNYYVKLTNDAGTRASQSAFIRVHNPIAITTQPVNVTTNVGLAANFTVGYNSTQTPAVIQWWKKAPNDADFAEIPGANGQQYTVAAASPSDDGTQFYVKISNDFSTQTSQIVTLTVSINDPVFVQQPQSQTVLSGTLVTLEAEAGGGDSRTYQWKLNGKDLAGQNGMELNLGAVTLAQAGKYTCEVTTNDGKEVTSREALVLRLPPESHPTSHGAKVLKPFLALTAASPSLLTARR